MKRRYKALIAILVPIVLVGIMKMFFPISYQWLMGYMVAVALVFKSSILSLWLLSKLKIITFIKSLSIFQAFLLIIKRWFMDNVLMIWVKSHVFDNLIEGLNDIKNYYLRLNLKAKLKNIFLILFGTIFSTWLLYFLGVLDNIFLFAQLKLFIAGVLKGIFLFFGKIFSWLLSWFAISWLAPILEVFALSYLLTLLERWLGANNPLSRFFHFVGDKINMLLYYLGILKRKHIDPMVECKIISNAKKVGKKLSLHIQNKKIREEYRYFERFENIILKGHIDAYHSFKGMKEITDKKALYTLINQKTNDNIDIVAYVSRNLHGTLLEEEIEDDYYHDIFLLESFASHQEHGIKVYDEDEDENHIDHSDFWVMNTSKFPVILSSRSKNFEDECILPHGLRLIKTKNLFCYASGDVYCEYEGIQVAVTAIERPKEELVL